MRATHFRGGPVKGQENAEIKRSHRSAFIVGGTGMLAEATRFIERQSAAITIVSRSTNAAKAFGLEAKSFCIADWRDTGAFARAVTPRLNQRPPDIALLWIHDNGTTTLAWLLEQLRDRATFIIHVISSSDTDAHLLRRISGEMYPNMSEPNYVAVALGSKALPHGGRRWLTHQEICEGVIKAIGTEHDVFVGDPIRSL